MIPVSSASVRSGAVAGSSRVSIGSGSRSRRYDSCRGAGGLGGVEGQVGGRGDEERGRADHHRAVAGLPAHPGVLHDVLGLGRAAEDPVGDAEQPRAEVGELGDGIVEVRGAGDGAAGSDGGERGRHGTAFRMRER